jgi:hypothetical protein
MNNLAVANVKVNKMSDARALLLEALHDADDLQKKLINTSLERLYVCYILNVHYDFVNSSVFFMSHDPTNARAFIVSMGTK